MNRKICQACGVCGGCEDFDHRAIAVTFPPLLSMAELVHAQGFVDLTSDRVPFDPKAFDAAVKIDTWESPPCEHTSKDPKVGR